MSSEAFPPTASVALAPGLGHAGKALPHDGPRPFDVVANPVAVAYTWDVVSDRVEWQPSAAMLLGLEGRGAPTTMSGFRSLIVDEHVRRHAAALELKDDADAPPGGVGYCSRFRFRPGGPRTHRLVEIEDVGRYWVGSDGRPGLARGVMRVLGERAPYASGLIANDYDHLTGQLSRPALTDALTVAIDRCATQGEPTSFMIASITNLHGLNQAFGFEAGDRVLCEVGRRIHGKLRSGDTLGRYSSNKFGIVLRECDSDAIHEIADRILRTVCDTPISGPFGSLGAIVSIGGVLIERRVRSVQACVHHALRALDEARRSRGPRFSLYEVNKTPELRRIEQLDIGERVANAISANRLDVVLQPIVDAKTRTPAFYESLLRLNEPGGHDLPAGVFIPVAEQLGLSGPIDRAMLGRAVHILSAKPALTVSLNVSALTCCDAAWLKLLETLVGGKPDIARRLIVEITETSAIEDLDETALFVDAVRELGCRVAIDDFGAGHTSFRYLRKLNADILKIDGEFIRDIRTDKANTVFVRAILDIAHALGMQTVAEWVADEDCADHLQAIGVDYLQGYHFGEPMAVTDLPSGR